MAPIILTPDQEQYLRDNYEFKFLRVLAADLKVSMSSMQNLIDKYGLRKERKKGWSRCNGKPVEKKRENKSVIIKVRSSAEHSNMSRDQHIDKWLNAQI